MLSWRSPGDPQAGGAEGLTLELLQRAVLRGHEVTWFAARFESAPDDEMVDGIRFVRQGRQWTVHYRAWRWLRKRQDEFDVVVDQINTLPFLTPLYVSESKRRLLIHQTAREYWWRQTKGVFRLLAPFGYVAEPQYLKTYRSTEAITISQSTREELIGLGLSPDRVTVIPMAVATPPLHELAPKTPPFRLIAISRLTPAKFVEETIDAFANVRAVIPESVLDIVGGGDPDYRAKLERDVAARGLSDAVTFHGHVSEERKLKLLTDAHVHIFTSHREGWGMTVTEAGARGTPTVGYDAPGVRDSVRNPTLVAPIADGATGLTKRIVALYNDPAVYEDVREEAWTYAASLSYEACADTFLSALEK